MRVYSRISPKVWRSPRFRGLPTDRAKAFYLYTLSCEHQSSAGCFRLPDAYAAADLAWTESELDEARSTVIAADLLIHDPATEEYFVPRWFKHNPSCNTKHRKGIERLISEMDSDIVREAAEMEFAESIPVESENPLDTPMLGGGRLTNTRYFNGGGGR